MRLYAPAVRYRTQLNIIVRHALTNSRTNLFYVLLLPLYPQKLHSRKGLSCIVMHKHQSRVTWLSWRKRAASPDSLGKEGVMKIPCGLVLEFPMWLRMGICGGLTSSLGMRRTDVSTNVANVALSGPTSPACIRRLTYNELKR